MLPDSIPVNEALTKAQNALHTQGMFLISKFVDKYGDAIIEAFWDATTERGIDISEFSGRSGSYAKNFKHYLKIIDTLERDSFFKKTLRSKEAQELLDRTRNRYNITKNMTLNIAVHNIGNPYALDSHYNVKNTTKLKNIMVSDLGKLLQEIGEDL